MNILGEEIGEERKEAEHSKSECTFLKFNDVNLIVTYMTFARSHNPREPHKSPLWRIGEFV